MRYLLVVDSIGNVALGDADSGVRMPIGDPLIPSQRSRVSSAVWSPAGEWTAWSVDSDSPDGVRELRFHDEETDEASVLAESVSAFYLCPSPCGRWLSHLSPGPLGLELAISEVVTGELRVIERGQPLFWSWSPDATRLAVHVEDRVLIAGLDGEPPTVLCDHAGPFIVPWWLPSGSVAFAIDDQIVCRGHDGETTTLIERGTTGRFAPDPDGRRIAHIEDDGERRRLIVVDLLTGEHEEVTAEPVGGFFWSPDGLRLAALVPAEGSQIRWIVADGSDVVALPPFRPTRSWATSVLPFFEQYAQSHSHWSADSKQLVAPAIDDAGSSGILIQEAEVPYRSQWMPDAQLVWWA